MRDAVIVRVGGADYRLLPTFAVVDAFEDRHGSLMAHLQRIVDVSATLTQRGTLLLEAMRAAYKDEGKNPDRLELQAMKQRMFEAGMWSDDLVRAEIDLCERLLYTPEQYLEKKAQRARAEADVLAAMAQLDAFAPSTEQPSQP